MVNRKPPSAPAHLQPATRAWWRSVLDDYSLEPHHLRLLQLAGECWDRCQQARAALDEHGLTVETNSGIKARPEVAIERDSRLAFARMLRELDLDVEAPAPERARPPSLRSNRRS